jgi:hypothetical protein
MADTAESEVGCAPLASVFDLFGSRAGHVAEFFVAVAGVLDARTSSGNGFRARHVAICFCQSSPSRSLCPKSDRTRVDSQIMAELLKKNPSLPHLVGSVSDHYHSPHQVHLPTTRCVNAETLPGIMSERSFNVQTSTTYLWGDARP